MKKSIYIFLIVVFFASCGENGKIELNSWKIDGLKGKVKSFKKIRYLENNLPLKIDETETIFYNNAGKRASKEYNNIRDDQYIKSDYRYEAENIFENEIINKSEKKLNACKYVYNKGMNLVKIYKNSETFLTIKYDKNGSITYKKIDYYSPTKIKYSYDEKKRKTQEIILNSILTNYKIFEIFYIIDSIINYYYNEDGLLWKKIISVTDEKSMTALCYGLKANEVLSEELFFYDNDGFLIKSEEKGIDARINFVNNKTYYEYDKNKNLLSKKKSDDKYNVIYFEKYEYEYFE